MREGGKDLRGRDQGELQKRKAITSFIEKRKGERRGERESVGEKKNPVIYSLARKALNFIAYWK